MAQKRNRVRKAGIVPVPNDEDKTGFLNKLDEDLKRLKPYKPKPKPKAKPKPPKRGDKKFRTWPKNQKIVATNMVDKF